MRFGPNSPRRAAASSGDKPPGALRSAASASSGESWWISIVDHRPLRASDVKNAPGATQRLLIEELDAAESYSVGAARYLLDGAQVHEVRTNLFFRERVRRRVVEPGQLSHGVNVGANGALGVPAQLEILNHALAEWGHEILSKKG